MSRPELLSKELIDNHSALLPMWINDGLSLKRQFILSNFASAIGFINAIAILSEAMDHHPDIHLYGWNKVSVLISTHDKGGLTELDFQLASKIDSISFRYEIDIVEKDAIVHCGKGCPFFYKM